MNSQQYVGQIVGKKYLCVRFIDAGTFASVYQARTASGVQFAVKVLFAFDLPDALTRFGREIKVMQALPESPHLVQYVDAGVTDDGRPFMAMQYVPGPTLREVMEARPMLPPDEGAVVVYQIARALQAIHRYGIVHRDVKPANVLMANDGVVKLFDFGLVLDSEGMLKLFEAEDILGGHDFVDDIEQGAVAGTPEYMAPEQFEDALQVEEAKRKTAPASDVFSLGVILHRLLAGRVPYPMKFPGSEPSRDDMVNYLKWRCKVTSTDLAHPASIDSALWSIMTRALSTEPWARQPDSRALADELYGYITSGTGTQRLAAPTTALTPIVSEASIACLPTDPRALSAEELFSDLDLASPKTSVDMRPEFEGPAPQYEDLGETDSSPFDVDSVMETKTWRIR